MQRFRHIHLKGLGEAPKQFEAHGGGGATVPSPVQNRSAHARRLRGDLKNIADAIQDSVDLQARAGVPEKRRGQAVVFEGRVDEQLVVGSAGVDSARIQVLNVRRKAASHNMIDSRDQATVFVTPQGLDTLLEGLEKYRAWKIGDRPQRFWLFESADSFKPAVLEDFWTDSYLKLPADRGEFEWEVWTRHSLDDAFHRVVDQIGLNIAGEATRFVDTSVRNVIGTYPQISRLIRESASVVELRGASSFIADHSALPAETRLENATALARRIVPAGPNAPSIAILDTGVNRNNPLLKRSLAAENCYRADSRWEALDKDGHGTKMAGVALFGDLADFASGSEPIDLEVALESVTVADPSSAIKLPARDALARAVKLVEGSDRRRIYCLAATAPGEAEDGRPSSTSATLDKLAFGDGKATRLFCAAVGNVQTDPTNPYLLAQYADRNIDHGIQSPAQALNALSVGAATQKCLGANLVAPMGDLSPTSRTAQAWEVLHPHKPDIVMEGGNHIIDQKGLSSRPHIPNMVVTTSRDVKNRPITVTGETSAATAAAAGLAARLAARYPALRAETIRGLIVHSAVWTDAMIERHAQLVANGVAAPEAWAKILELYGWGIPDEERLFWSANNALTLIAEDELRPYKREPKKSVTLREMKYFRFPWPNGALAALGNTEVTLRCTLSYFIDPDPNNVTRDQIELYTSHRLKFDFKRFDETDVQAQSRINKALSVPGSRSLDDSGWTLGSRYKTRGTLHQDIWRGPAYQLEQRNGISVGPVRGWWADRADLKPEDRSVPFSLIVSISTPEQNVDLYAEVMTRVPARLLVNVPAIVRR